MKSRTNKELLQLTLSEGIIHFNKGDKFTSTYRYGYRGLCGFVYNHLYCNNIITEKEQEILMTYIGEHRPRNSQLAFYWPSGQWTPRQKWLKYHINKIK
jgi:hypothetical protein